MEILKTIVLLIKNTSRNGHVAFAGLLISTGLTLLLIVNVWPSHIPPWSSWYNQISALNWLRLVALGIPGILLALNFFAALLSLAGEHLQLKQIT